MSALRTSLRSIAFVVLLVACAEDRGIEVWSSSEYVGSPSPLTPQLRLDTMTVARASEVIRDGDGEIEEVVPGCVTGESSAAEVVEVVSQAGSCDQFALIARGTGAATLVFRKGELVREMTVRVPP